MQPPLLEVHDLHKRFGSVQALDGVGLSVHAGSVLALLGDNGAGKSTLVKIVSGVHSPDAGSVALDGSTVELSSPRQASGCGIETVYQDLALCENLSVTQNLFLGRERRHSGNRLKGWFLDRHAMRQEAERAFQVLGSRIPSLSSPVSSLSGGQRQAVAIARAIVWRSRLVMFDEPTAALGVEQTANVHQLIRRLRDQGVGVLLVTHNMVDVFALADRIVVLRRGKRIAELNPTECTPDDVVSAITGSSIAARES
ncbi:MAG: ATP-binding cassette domain-containing protein [Rhodobacteraceae bacterium]|nr:ATP-binding cassette domain-containing protein [Paracoccaceae bacterium]